MGLLEGLRFHHRLLGLPGILLAAAARVLRAPIEVGIAVEGISRPVYLRLRTTDVSLFEEVLFNSEYWIEPATRPRTILDAGANIGLTSIFFANAFPEAAIMAVEPEESNFELLKRNTAPYSNVFPIQAALWKENAVVGLSDPGTGHWGYQTREKRGDDSPCEAIHGRTVDSLMREYGWNWIDVLKIDIEGAEKEVFETSEAWINRVGVIMVELHDHFKDGCSSSMKTATRGFVLEECRGETTILVRAGYELRPRQLSQPTELAFPQSSGWPHRCRPRIVALRRPGV